MKITWLPAIHFNEGTHVLSGLSWTYGEIKDVDPDWTVRVRADGVPVNVQIVDDLLSNPEYVAVDEQDDIPSADQPDTEGSK